jgi:hypothetical protein
MCEVVEAFINSLLCQKDGKQQLGDDRKYFSLLIITGDSLWRRSLCGDINTSDSIASSIRTYEYKLSWKGTYSKTRLCFFDFLGNTMELRPSWDAASRSAAQEFPNIFGTRRFITVLSRALRWFLSWARWIQFISLHPVSLGSIFILSSHLRFCNCIDRKTRTLEIAAG